MTEKLQEQCVELRKALSSVEESCRAAIDSLHRFETHVEFYAAARLLLKLMILKCWVATVAEARYKEHQGQGYVFVFLRENEGTTLQWIEKEQIVADRDRWLLHYGYIVLSVPEFTQMVAKLLIELAAGKWAEVLDWVKRYGTSPGLDFEKFE